MICSKCGTHLPDGTAFCPSCGNQLNFQPTAPIMPVEPIAPVMSGPSMGGPTMGNPVMCNPYMSTPPKKSKAPLFIGLGIIALVIAIVSIVLVLLFAGGEDDKKAKKVSSTETTSIKTEGSSTEKDTEETTEETTTEPDTTVVGVIDYDEAEDIVLNFLDNLSSENYSKAGDYILPVLVDVLCDAGYANKAEAMKSTAISFTDWNGNFYDYEIAYSEEYDNSRYEYLVYDLLEDGCDIKNYPSHKEPTAFAIVTVELSTGNNYDYLDIYLVYVDGEFYIIDYNFEDFDLLINGEPESESETTTNVNSDFDFEKSLNENYHTLSNSIEGTVHQFDDYTLIIPDTWETSTSNSISPDMNSVVTFGSSTPISAQTKMNYLKELCKVYIERGYTNFEFGNLNANGKEGYYIEYDTEYSSEIIHAYIFIFFSPSDDKLFLTVVTTSDITSSCYDDALAIASSIEIQ